MNDLIGRKDAIDVVSGIDRDFVRYIEALPSAEPKWILCSDRMPPDPAGCFVTAMDEVFTIGFIARWTGEQWCDDAGNPCLCDVIAWMPLPKLYEV